MDISSGDAFAAALPDLDSEPGSLDWFGYMDLDLDEFWDGADVASFFAVPAGKDVGLGLPASDGGGRESSPDSVVTDDDGAPSSEPAGDNGDDGREMSGYVSELERFLMEDGHNDDESVGPEPTAAAKEDLDLATDEHYFLGNHYVADDGCAEAGADIGADKELVELAAGDDYFFDDFYVPDDGCAEPGADAAADDAETVGAEEELAAEDYYFDDDFYVVDDGFGDAEPVALDQELSAGDEYCFDDFSVADDGCAEPAAGVVDPALPDDKDEEEEDGFAARVEDEATSRKRASSISEAELRAGDEKALHLRCRRPGLGHRRLPLSGVCGSAWLST